MKFDPRDWGKMLTSPTGERFFRLLFWLAAAYALFGGVILRLWAPIILKHDNAYFMPLVYAIRNGLGFTNPWASPTGSAVFDWHGIMHPLLLSWLAPTTGWAGVNAAAVATGAVAMTITLLLIYRTNAPMVIKALCALFIPAVFIGYSGRPETTATLFLVLLIAINFTQTPDRVSRWRRLLASGALLGLLGATHPLAAVMTTVAYCSFLAIISINAERSATDTMISVTAAGLTALATFVLVFLVFFPPGIETWIPGVLRHGDHIADRLGEGDFLKYFAATKHTPFLLLTFLPLLYVIAVWGRDLWPRADLFHKTVLVFGAAGLVVLIARFPVGVPATYYNYTVLLPALAVCVCLTFNRDRLRTWPGAVVALCLAGFAGFCWFGQALWVYQTVAGAPVREVQRQEIAALVGRHVTAGHKVAVDSPLIAALDDTKTALSVNLLHFGRKRDGGNIRPSADVFDIVVRAQAEFAAPPPKLTGFTLIKNAYRTGFGATSFSKPEHLGYAVYRSIKRAPRISPQPPSR